MHAKSLILTVLSLTLPLLVAGESSPYRGCVTAKADTCGSKFQDTKDLFQRSQQMEACIHDIIKPGGRCYSFP